MASDSPISEANKQIVLSNSHFEQGQSSAPVVVKDEEMVEADDTDSNNYQLMVIPEAQEFGCKYCEKTYPNKQALGGHQNAHKVERTIAKNVAETGQIGFFAGHAPHFARMTMEALIPYLTAVRRRQEILLHRSIIARHMAGARGGRAGGRGVVVPFNRRLPGLNAYVYHPWSSHPRVPGFPGRYRYTMPVSVRLSNFEPGSSNVYHSGLCQGFPVRPPGFDVQPGRENLPAEPINLRNVAEEEDASGLDLSLKLGCAGI